MGDVIYLTGSSGFIGQMIVKQCESDDSIQCVYCPIRDKRNESGKFRFDNLFGTSSSKAKFCALNDPLPHDVTHVILNAYEVKFYSPIEHILKANVKPMLDILSQCRTAGERIRGISVVSTAYMQPPLPYRRDVNNRIEFVLKKRSSAFDLYQDLVTGQTTGDEVIEQYGDLLTNHHKINNYAFSKHIMEHVLHEQYSDLPICIVRPSIVTPTRDGQYGHGTRTGFPLFMEIARNPVLRFPRNEGRLNLVFVEDVSTDILRATRELAKPAIMSEKGSMFHPIYSSTSTSEMTAVDMFRLGAPEVRRFHISNHWLRDVLRRFEILIIRVAKGQSKAALVEKMYENFDPIMSNNWDFEETHPPNAAVVIASARKYYDQNRSDDSVTDSWINDVSIGFLLLSLVTLSWWRAYPISPSFQIVVLFVLLRLAALSVMQSLFCGDTMLRKLVPSTINMKAHDENQHQREIATWPSVLFSGFEMYIVFQLGILPDPTEMPIFSSRGFVIMLLTHALPVELIYYWAHRMMHTYSSIYRIHKHHHLSIVPTPKTSVTFLWSEHIFYDLLFAFPVLAPAVFGEASLVTTLLYIPLFDAVNCLGHTNLEVFPAWYIKSPLYLFFYCTTFHHVHHKYFKYNYALFMPIYDIVFGTYSSTRTESDFYAAQKRRFTTSQ